MKQARMQSKAKRIQQETLDPKQVTAWLKSERVQQRLKRLSGWRLRKDGSAMDRVRRYGDSSSASGFASYVCKLAATHRQPVTVGLAGKQVVITLTGHPVHNGGINDNVLDLAEAIG